MNSASSKVLLIGSGEMAYEYLRVLDALNKSVIIVGRGDSKVLKLKELFPKHEYHTGGLEKYLALNSDVPEFAVNTVNVEFLTDTTCQLLTKGGKFLLIEKPGSLTKEGLSKINDLANANNAKVLIAYNRRFYASVSHVISEAQKDGGITSLSFEFTEWIHTINPGAYDCHTLNRWVLANSSHVIDTAFYLIGSPKDITAKVSGIDRIEWHPTGDIFVGMGESINHVPFTYHANWNGPGRWVIEVSTSKRRFYLKPMEKVMEQMKGSVAVNEVVIKDELDSQFKPGIYLQTQAFLDGRFQNFQTMENQINAMEYYNKIGGY